MMFCANIRELRGNIKVPYLQRSYFPVDRCTRSVSPCQTRWLSAGVDGATVNSLYTVPHRWETNTLRYHNNTITSIVPKSLETMLRGASL